MQSDPTRKRRELAAEMLGLNPDGAWNTTLYHRAIRTKIGHELRAKYELPQEIPPPILALLMQIDALQDAESRATAGNR